MRIAARTIGVTSLVLCLAVPGFAQSPSDLRIVPGTGIGRVVLGQSVRQVIALLGPPKATYMRKDFTLYAWFDNVQGGAGRHLGRGLSVLTNTTRNVVEVTAYYDPRYQTKDGLRVGMAPARIRAALGEPSRILSQRDGYTLLYQSDGISFHVITDPQVEGYQTVVWIAVFRKH